MERFCIQTQTLLSFLLVLLLFISRSFASTKNDDVDGGKRVQIRVGLVLDLGSLKGKIVKNSVSMALSYFYAIHNDYKTRVSVSVRNSHVFVVRFLKKIADLTQNAFRVEHEILVSDLEVLFSEKRTHLVPQ